jgi:hypothetical protein
LFQALLTGRVEASEEAEIVLAKLGVATNPRRSQSYPNSPVRPGEGEGCAQRRQL